MTHEDELDFRRLFHDVPCGYVVTDSDGTLTRASREFLRMVGAGHDEVVGTRSLASFLTAAGRIFLETHLLPMLGHDGGVREIDLDLVDADGVRVPVLLNATPIGEGGAMRVVLLETRDRHRYERDLREATRAAREAMRDSAALAHSLQLSLIPPAPPAIPFLEVAAAYRPAGDGTMVGGDFYDVFQTAPHTWVVALGDVSGKGIGAATVTSFVRHTIRALSVEHDDPSEVLHHLDRLMHDHRTEHYCTVVLARLTLLDDRVATELSLAGHPPVLRRGPDGTTEELGIFGTPVGLVQDSSFRTLRFDLTDEVLVLYTDGVTESRGSDLYGERRLAALVAEGPHDPERLTEAVVAAALNHQAGVASDDIAVVVLARRPSQGHGHRDQGSPGA